MVLPQRNRGQPLTVVDSNVDLTAQLAHLLIDRIATTPATLRVSATSDS